MPRVALWFVTVILVVGAFYIWFVAIPGRRSEMAQRGKREHGTIQMKDSQPLANGGMAYTFTVIFPDAQNRNHSPTIRMLDQGKWNGSKIGDDIIVYYLPENPDKATVEGGEGMAAPHSAALSFIAWTMFIASGFVGYAAYKAPKPERKSRNNVTIARH